MTTKDAITLVSRLNEWLPSGHHHLSLSTTGWAEDIVLDIDHGMCKVVLWHSDSGESLSREAMVNEIDRVIRELGRAKESIRAHEEPLDPDTQNTKTSVTPQYVLGDFFMPDIKGTITPKQYIYGDFWMPPSDEFLIWSGEHKMYWRPGRCGYTSDPPRCSGVHAGGSLCRNCGPRSGEENPLRPPQFRCLMSSAVTFAKSHGFYAYDRAGSRRYLSSDSELIIPYGSKWAYWRRKLDKEKGRKPAAVCPTLTDAVMYARGYEEAEYK
jgi:hypothetical protein